MNRRTLLKTASAAAALAALPAAASAEDWRLGFRTAPSALDSELSLLAGRLPDGIEGRFFRIGPAQFERAGERLGHWFDGDGMIQRFEIADGRVRHRGRFVDTAKRRAEDAAGRFLHSGYGFAPQALKGIRSLDDMNAANTSVLPIAGELWALWEGGSPFRIGIGDLETRGRQVFSGRLDGAPFSAHPKTTADGETWNFGVLGRLCVLWHLGPDGAVRRSGLVELPVACLVHDFAVTERHIVLLLPPMIADEAPARTLVDRHRWHPDRPLIALVLDKDTFAVTRRYDMPARFLFHIGNAWEDRDGTIRFDAFLDADAAFATEGARDLAQLRAPARSSARPSLLTLGSDGQARVASLPGTGEFPRIDPRRVGLRHRYTYGTGAGGLARWDWEQGRQEGFDHGAAWGEEPVFVPRPGGSAEDDGWLVQTVLRFDAGRTELAVFDARAIADGPVAAFGCPYALPIGFHGAFVAA